MTQLGIYPATGTTKDGSKALGLDTLPLHKANAHLRHSYVQCPRNYCVLPHAAAVTA